LLSPLPLLPLLPPLPPLPPPLLLHPLQFRGD
jgi:hypothetical protein